MSVFVSGTTGFIAKHIVGQLLEQNYKVIEIVEDISRSNAFDEVISKHTKEIKYIIHTTSPFHFETTEYVKDLLNPAIQGTKDISESTKKYTADTVECVVITSSYAAIKTFKRENDSTFIVNENNWNPYNWETCQANDGRAYCGDIVKFKLSTVNPAYVFGPQRFDDNVAKKLNTSCELVNSLIYTPSDDLFKLAGISADYVDVRDVVKAHLIAFQSKETVDQRLMLYADEFSSQDIADILNEDFNCLKGQIPIEKPHMGILGVDPQGCIIDNSKTRRILGFELIDLKKTIHDTAA